MRREIAILRKVSYDRNIVQFYGACTAEPTMLCMEYMEVRRSCDSTICSTPGAGHMPHAPVTLCVQWVVTFAFVLQPCGLLMCRAH